MVLTVSRNPPETFFLATTFEPGLDFMTNLAGAKAARSSQATSAKSRAGARLISRARHRGRRLGGDYHPPPGQRRALGWRAVQPRRHSPRGAGSPTGPRAPGAPRAAR